MLNSKVNVGTSLWHSVALLGCEWRPYDSRDGAPDFHHGVCAEVDLVRLPRVLWCQCCCRLASWCRLTGDGSLRPQHLLHVHELMPASLSHALVTALRVRNASSPFASRSRRGGRLITKIFVDFRVQAHYRLNHVCDGFKAQLCRTRSVFSEPLVVLAPYKGIRAEANYRECRELPNYRELCYANYREHFFKH